jgi:hypothetical protein
MSSIEFIRIPPAALRLRSSGDGPPEEVLVYT